MSTKSTLRARAGFTLVEMLIIVIILGLLAMIVLPSFVSADGPAKESLLRDHLRIMRIQIELYTAQHRGTPPGYPSGDRTASPTSAAFLDQLTSFTGEDGSVSATYSASTPIRPYMDRLPANPFNNLTTVLVVGDFDNIPAADGLVYGWYYKPATRKFIANTPGVDAAGSSYASY